MTKGYLKILHKKLHENLVILSIVLHAGFDIIKSSNKPRFEREDFIMTTIVLKDWYYDNCVTYPSYGWWQLNWGVAICKNSTTKTVGAYRTLRGEIVGETEKAIHFKCHAVKYNSRCDIIGHMDWSMWLPKKGLVDDMKLTFYDGGQGQYVDRDMLDFLRRNPDYKSAKTWAFK